MSDEKFIVNEGDGAKLVPVESKEPTIPTEKKKPGRPKKVKTDEVTVKPWYCSTCREDIDDKNAMKIGAGENRWAVFCPQCQRSFGFQDQAMHDKVADFIKNNPTGK